MSPECTLWLPKVVGGHTHDIYTYNNNWCGCFIVHVAVCSVGIGSFQGSSDPGQRHQTGFSTGTEQERIQTSGELTLTSVWVWFHWSDVV